MTELLPADERDKVRRIVDDLEDSEDRIAAIGELTSPATLVALAHAYNWDDGMGVPRAIMDHSHCDLGTALHLFKLAEGITWITSDQDWTYQEEWADFCSVLSKRIQDGAYKPKEVAFDPELTKVQQMKARKGGVPEVFLTSVQPT